MNISNAYKPFLFVIGVQLCDKWKTRRDQDEGDQAFNALSTQRT